MTALFMMMIMSFLITIIMFMVMMLSFWFE